MWMPGSKSCLGSGFPPCLCKHKGQSLARFSAAHLEPEIWQTHEKVGRGMEQSWPVLLMCYSVLFSLLEGGGEICLSQKFRLTVEKKIICLSSPFLSFPTGNFPVWSCHASYFLWSLLAGNFLKGTGDCKGRHLNLTENYLIVLIVLHWKSRQFPVKYAKERRKLTVYIE